VKRRIEESVDGICPEFRGIFSAGGPPPKITLTKYENKQRAENVKDGESL
jgi:hypothetical protein